MIEQASLVIGEGNWAVKSDSLLGYKINGGKYYPREMDVVRATTGTRINEDGLVELVPYNLLQQSNNFNTTWTIGSNTTLTSGFNDPFGGSNAWRLTMTSGGGTFCQQTFTFDAIPYTFSVWAKANGNTHLSLQINGSSEVSYVLTNEWQRITLTYTSTAGAALVAIGNSVSNEVDALIYGAQLNEGSTALDYLPTTDRLDVARIDYSSGSGALLVEPQRTNLLTYSSSFDNAAWALARTSSFGSGSIVNDTTAPDGTLTAEYIQQASSQTQSGGIYVSQTYVVGQTYTLSVYAKKKENSILRPGFAIGTAALGIFGQFDLENGVTLTPSAGVTQAIENIGNGWYRCSITATAQVSGSYLTFIYQASTINSNDTTPLTGIYIWGAQLELGSYPTSYIPTTSASVTRNADVISKTGITDLIGQTEGTIFFDGVINGCQNAGANFINSEKNLNTSFAIGYTKSNKNINASVFASGVAKGNITNGVFEIGERVKIAYAYKSGDFALYVNGSLMGTSTDTFTFPSTLDDIFIGDPATYFAFQEAITNNATALYKTRLTNAQLATLTTI